MDQKLYGPKADPVELNLWTMIPMSTTTRAMLDPEAEEVDSQTDAEQQKAFIRNLQRQRKDANEILKTVKTCS